MRSRPRITMIEPQHGGHREEELGDEDREQRRAGEGQQQDDRPTRSRPDGSAVAARVDHRCGPGQQALGRRDHRLRQQGRQASEVAGRAHALIARPAGRSVDVHRRRRNARIPPGRRPRGQRRTVDPDHRRRGRRGDVQRAGVAADEQPAARDDRPQLGQVEFAAVHDPARRVGAELLPRRGGDSIARPHDPTDRS